MSIKTIGQSGQLSLGKKYAGRTVQVEEVEEGVWTVKLGQFIPDNERWLLDPEVSKEIDEAAAWAEGTPRSETDLNELKERLDLGEEERSRSA